MWGHLTGGLDGGQSHTWSTPTLSDTCPNRDLEKQMKRNSLGLSEQVRISVQWPTPTASDTEGGLVKNVEMENGSFSRKNKDGVRWGVKLKDAVNHMERMWPTPRANSAMASTITPEVAWDQNRRPNLETEVGRRTWPTPIVDDANNVNPKANRFPTLVSQVKEQEGSGSLNCNWVEALMGYPQNWTSLDDGETDPGRKESPE